MFSKNNEGKHESKKRLKIAILAAFALSVSLGATSFKAEGNTNSVNINSTNAANAKSDSAITEIIVPSTMISGVNGNLSELVITGDSMFDLNKIIAEGSGASENALISSGKQIETKLQELKMGIYPAANVKTLKASTTTTTAKTTTTTKKTTTTTKKATTTTTKATTTTTKSSSSSTSSSASSGPVGSEAQNKAWNYLLQQSKYVGSDVVAHINAVKEFKEPFVLTDYERYEIERAVMAEIGSEPYVSVVAIAQCLRESAELEHLSPVTILTKYQWTSARIAPNQKVKDAVSAVFDYGIRVTNEKIMYFYAPALTSYRGHETMFKFVFQISKVRFFTSK